MTLDFENSHQALYRIAHWRSDDVSHVTSLGLGALWRKSLIVNASLINHVKSTCCQHDLLLRLLTLLSWIHWSGLSTQKSLLFSHFPYPALWKKVTVTGTFKEWGSSRQSSWIKCFKYFYMVDLSIYLTGLFNNFLISLWTVNTDHLFLYSLGYITILHYVFCSSLHLSLLWVLPS